MPLARLKTVPIAFGKAKLGQTFEEAFQDQQMVRQDPSCARVTAADGVHFDARVQNRPDLRCKGVAKQIAGSLGGRVRAWCGGDELFLDDLWSGSRA